MKDREPTKEDQIMATRLKSIWERKKGGLGLNQKLAGRLLGISQSAISQYMNGYLKFSISIVLKFSSLLEVDPEDWAPRFAKEIRTAKSSGRIPIVCTLWSDHVEYLHNRFIEISTGNPFVEGSLVKSRKYHRYPFGTIVLYDKSRSAEDGDNAVGFSGKEVYIGSMQGEVFIDLASKSEVEVDAAHPISGELNSNFFEIK